jgi:hypothetical protein
MKSLSIKIALWSEVVTAHHTPATTILAYNTSGPPWEQQWNYRSVIGILNDLSSYTYQTWLLHQCWLFWYLDILTKPPPVSSFVTLFGWWDHNIEFVSLYTCIVHAMLSIINCCFTCKVFAILISTVPEVLQVAIDTVGYFSVSCLCLKIVLSFSITYNFTISICPIKWAPLCN